LRVVCAPSRRDRARDREEERPTTKSGHKRRAAKNADTLALEKRLADALGLAISVDNRSRSLTVRYRSLISSTKSCGGRSGSPEQTVRASSSLPEGSHQGKVGRLSGRRTDQGSLRSSLVAT
jgi:hypothetical protein